MPTNELEAACAFPMRIPLTGARPQRYKPRTQRSEIPAYRRAREKCAGVPQSDRRQPETEQAAGGFHETSELGSRTERPSCPWPVG